MLPGLGGRTAGSSLGPSRFCSRQADDLTTLSRAESGGCRLISEPRGRVLTRPVPILQSAG